MIAKGALLLSAATAAVTVLPPARPTLAQVLGYEFEVGPMGVAIFMCLLLRYVKIRTDPDGEAKSSRTHWTVTVAVTLIVLTCAAVTMAGIRPRLEFAPVIGGSWGVAGKLIVRILDQRAGEVIGGLLGATPTKGGDT